MTIFVHSIDHRVLTTATVPRCMAFCTRVFGMQKLEYGSGRIAPGADVVEDPVARTGARFPLASGYIRHPAGNLIEVAESARFD